MPNPNYRNGFSESREVEISYDPHSVFGLMVADQAQHPGPDPLDVLGAIEEQLGCSIFEAARRYREMMNANRTHNN